MILNEQQYKNLNRNYFHGSRTGKIEEQSSLYDCFFLTNSFLYAAMYACQEDPFEGKVYRFNLKEGLNIFNAFSKKDVQTLRLYFHRNKITFRENWYQEGLQNEDWNLVFRKSSLRSTFIRHIQDCGFDGFFNYEWTDKFKEYYQIDKGSKIPTAPSVGIFDVSELCKKETLSYDDYFKYRDFSKEYESEKDQLIEHMKTIQGRKEVDFSESVKVFIQDFCAVLTYKDWEWALENESTKFPGKETVHSQLVQECLQEGLSSKYGPNRYVLDGNLILRHFSNSKQFESLKKKYKLRLYND